MNLRGDLQMHTEWSDGPGTVAAMADAADQRGYEYIAITDHAKKLKIAGGINEEELREQRAEIAAVNEQFAAKKRNFRVLRKKLAVRNSGRWKQSREAACAMRWRREDVNSDRAGQLRTAADGNGRGLWLLFFLLPDFFFLTAVAFGHSELRVVEVQLAGFHQVLQQQMTSVDINEGRSL
jgi:hypothetical protein